LLHILGGGQGSKGGLGGGGGNVDNGDDSYIYTGEGIGQQPTEGYDGIRTFRVARCFLVQDTKMGRRPQNIPNGNKIHSSGQKDMTVHMKDNQGCQIFLGTTYHNV
jgi:hypothetical protein